MNRTVRIVSIGCIVSLVSGAVFSILSIIDWRNFSRPEKVSPVMLAGEASVFGVLIIQFGLLWYVYDTAAASGALATNERLAKNNVSEAI
mmetsp:Transcript_5779/g.7558  ORF Transcript_5779/g.7558 Transcript_5779/m.7558 type:complete len:90 (-) Transcript_5779:1526-1795(-)